MTLYLIDGSSYIYRAYHAIRGLSNSKGFPTNAIFGFTNMLIKIIREKRPEALCIVFDSPVPTERHKLYEQYKAQRPEAPNDLVVQIPHIKEIIRAFRVTAIEMPGYEADDIICTVARRVSEQGMDVFIVSSDKDMMQIVSERVRIFDPMKDVVIDEKTVLERFGLPPERLNELMALTGDAIDNIPGVKGIGEKTAKELLQSAGSIDDLLDNPGAIRKEKLRALIAENREIIRLSKTLATVNADLPVHIDLESLKAREPEWTEILRLFREFEFRSLMNRIPAVKGEPRGTYRTVMTREELRELIGRMG